MMRKVMIITVLLVIGGICTYSLRFQKELPDADFVYVIPDSIKTIDPACASWQEDIRMVLALWEGLYSYDPLTLKPVPAVAAGFPVVSDDGLVYTFTLKELALWSNGDPVVAADFVYGWRRAIEPGASGDYYALIADNIAGAKDYLAWRNDAVRVLKLLGQLHKDGSVPSVDSDDYALLEKYSLLQKYNAGRAWPDIAAEFRSDHIRQMAGRFDNVGIKALSKNSLEVTLVRKMPYFLDLLPFSTFVPVHEKSLELLRCDKYELGSDRIDAVSKQLTLWSYDSQWVKPDYRLGGYPGLITNGAYTLTNWQFKRFMLFEKNIRYWNVDNVKSDTIMARIMPQSNTAFMAYEAGEIDFYHSLSTLGFADTLLKNAQDGKRNDIHKCDAFGCYYYAFNCQDTLHTGKDNPFKDSCVRMAFNMAVDKQAIVDKVKRIGNRAARNFIPPGSIEGYSCPLGAGFDPEGARKLLDEAGFPGGRGLGTIELLYNTGDDHESVAQAVQAMWKENLGVDVRLAGKEKKTFNSDKSSQRFMVGRASWFGDYNDPTTFLDILRSGSGQNDSGYSNIDGYDALLDKASEVSRPDKRMEILSRAESVMLADSPILPIYYYVVLSAFRPEVEGLRLNSMEFYPLKNIKVRR